MKICSAMIGIKFTFGLVHRMSLLLLQHPEPPTAYNRLFSLLVTSFLRAELRDCKSEQSQLLFLSTTVVFYKAKFSVFGTCSKLLGNCACTHFP